MYRLEGTSYSRRLLALIWSYRKLNFRFKSRPTQLRISEQNQEIPVARSSSPIKIWGKSVHGFPSYDQTNKQTNSDQNFIYIDSLTGVINSLLETFYIIDYKNTVNQNSKSTLLSIGLILSHFNKYRCKSHIHITLYIICNLTMLINYYLKPISPYYYMYYDLA